MHPKSWTQPLECIFCERLPPAPAERGARSQPDRRERRSGLLFFCAAGQGRCCHADHTPQPPRKKKRAARFSPWRRSSAPRVSAGGGVALGSFLLTYFRFSLISSLICLRSLSTFCSPRGYSVMVIFLTLPGVALSSSSLTFSVPMSFSSRRSARRS